MSTLRYKVNFKYVGQGCEFIPETTKRLIEDLFIGMREIVVEETNPRLDEWNKEFDELYPGKDGYSIEYANFIMSKFGPYVASANESMSKIANLRLGYEIVDNENNFTDFVMKAKFGACMVKVYITLEEIDGK